MVSIETQLTQSLHEGNMGMRHVRRESGPDLRAWSPQRGPASGLDHCPIPTPPCRKVTTVFTYSVPHVLWCQHHKTHHHRDEDSHAVAIHSQQLSQRVLVTVIPPPKPRPQSDRNQPCVSVQDSTQYSHIVEVELPLIAFTTQHTLHPARQPHSPSLIPEYSCNIS